MVTNIGLFYGRSHFNWDKIRINLEDGKTHKKICNNQSAEGADGLGFKRTRD